MNVSREMPQSYPGLIGKLAPAQIATLGDWDTYGAPDTPARIALTKVTQNLVGQTTVTDVNIVEPNPGGSGYVQPPTAAPRSIPVWRP